MEWECQERLESIQFWSNTISNAYCIDKDGGILIIARGILAALWPLSKLPQNKFDDYLNFTFLYGLLPPAITPVVLAQSFNVMPDLILNAMMIAILLTAPYMFLHQLYLV